MWPIALSAALLLLVVSAPVLAHWRGSADLEVARAEPAYNPTPDPLPTPAPVVAVIGDSISAGTNAQVSGDSRWSALLNFRDGWNFSNISIAGAGYLSGGTVNQQNKMQRTFADAIRVVPRDAQAVIFFGSRDDGVADPAALTRAASAAFGAARKQAPDAAILVVGPVWTSSTVPTGLAGDRAALRNAAAAAHATWLDPIAADWLPRTGEFYSSDGISLTALGQRRLADRMQGPLRVALGRAG